MPNNDKLEVKLESMVYQHIVPLLGQMAEDQQLTTAETRRLRFTVDEQSFEPLFRYNVLYSEDLFLHCVFNLLDNAAKYSRGDSEVQIRGRYDEVAQRFVVSISNLTSPKGHRIDKVDKDRLMERGERGDRARLTTAGGRGIGLWIAKKFMEAVKGDLNILSTDSRDRNVFNLRFRTGIPPGDPVHESLNR